MSPRTDRAAAGSRLDSGHQVCGPTIQGQEQSLFIRSWVVGHNPLSLPETTAQAARRVAERTVS
jgi:hypothetical protein